MSVEAWPFAVTRNRMLDWRPILAPDFLLEADGDFMLTYETAADESGDPDRVFRKEVALPQSQQVTLVYRQLPLTADWIGGSADDRLRDEFGRELDVVEGLVMTGEVPDAEDAFGTFLPQLHPLVRKTLASFWEETDEAARAEASHRLAEPMAGASANAGVAGRAGSGRPGRRSGRRAAVAAVLLAAAVLGLIRCGLRGVRRACGALRRRRP